MEAHPTPAGSEMKWLIPVGLVITLLGAALGFWGVWVTEDQALEIGQARLSGDNREQDLQLPSVQNLISQSRFAMAGFVFIFIGTGLQIVGAWPRARKGQP